MLKGSLKLFVKQSGKREWPSPDVLRLGTKVYGWILLNNVSLGYELWRMYNGFPINLNSSQLHIGIKKSHPVEKTITIKEQVQNQPSNIK